MSHTITGNLNQALLNSNYLWNKVVWGIRNRAATWRAITGYTEPGVKDPVSKALKFNAIEDTSGFEMGLQFNMALAEYEKVRDDGSADLEVVTGEYIEDVDEVTWDMTHYARSHFISDKKRKKNMGKVKTEALMEVTLATLARGKVKQINRELFLDNDQGEDTMLGLLHAIDEDNVYGFDRSLSRYADLRSYVATAGALTWEKIALARTSVVDMGGMSEVVVCGATVYNYVEYLCRTTNTVQIKTDDKWAGFGGEIFHYGNTVFSLDTDCPSGKMFGISVQSEEGMPHWKVARNDAPASAAGFTQEKSRRGHPWVLPIDFYLWLGCATPGAQWRLDGVTAPSGYSA